MCAKIDRPRKRRTRNAPPMTLPDDLYDYLDDRPQPRDAALRHNDGRLVTRELTVIDDWPDRVPVTEAEIDVFERYFGDVLDRLFGASHS